MKIEVKIFKSILEALRPGLSTGSETTEQSSCFAFKDGKAFSYNDEISVTTPFPLPDIEGVIPSKKLLDLMGKLRAKEMDIQTVDGEFRIQCGKVKAGLAMDESIHMPIDEITIPKKKEWMDLPEEFPEALKKCVFSASTDPSTPALNHIRCFQGQLESTDGDRGTRCDMGDEDYFQEQVLIHYQVAKYLSSGGMEKYCQKGDWIHFLSGDTVFSCRSYDEDKWPELDHLYKLIGRKFVFPEETKGILERAQGFAETDLGKEGHVSVSIFSRGTLLIRAESLDQTDWFEEKLKLTKPPKKDVSFNMNPQYLLQILSLVNSATISDNMVLFRSPTFSHVVAMVVV